ncbi:MAG: 3-dehydroquinate synthase [Ruminiclostridium sp.]|nr:3-dehydroquinate synthase [Ruminiclostridium sp.]
MNKITVKASNSYDVLIGSGLLSRAEEYIAPVLKSSRAVIVSDDNVFPLYGETLKDRLTGAGFTVNEFVFPHGEQSKSHEVLLNLYGFLAANNITRSDAIIALGGGVTGDLAGFAAATYLRGIRYVQVPTSLLAQIDSSVGGKTAVDIPAGKNLVGAFKQPKLVLADTDTLNTLPDAFFSDGMGEAVKYGMIRSKELFDMIAAGNIREHLEEMIVKCVDIKRDVVENDEFDKGLRMTLNFGHTLGHAIEKTQNFCGLSHGNAVAVGMYLITTAAEKNGLIDGNISGELRRCLEVNGLPYSVDIPPEKLFLNAVNDKKRFSDDINIIICKTIGKADIVKMPVDDFGKLIKTLER